jgi:tRNA-specific 2-thiouridylase
VCSSDLALRRGTVEAASCRWIAGNPPPAGTLCEAQLRAHGTAHPARIETSNENGEVRVRFDAPVDQAAPGQSLVLYRGDEILGGGLIRRAA